MRYELSDFEWAAIKPLLPNKSRGVRRVNDRRVLVALFGWALVYLASAPTYRHDVRRPTASRFRKWLDATRHRLLKA